jgi:hypothetical protein
MLDRSTKLYVTYSIVILVGGLLVTPAQAKRPHCISSITGKFVPQAYANKHPSKTICRQIRKS